jgi:flavin reductase (DIM6/NTAB) family NADH-FMN oxidoreductase RutF
VAQWHDGVVRRDFDPRDNDPSVIYSLLTATVVPRPIAWVSSRSAAGVDNLAPHSFFTVACARPPIVQFTSVGKKDSLRNARETGEFVVNLAPEPLFEHVNATGTNYPAEVSEFEAIGVTPAPSSKVSPWRVAESPVAIECTLNRTVELGDSTIVLGDVMLIAIEESTLDLTRPDRPHPRIEALRPLARLGRDEWGLIGEVRRIKRIPYEST